MSPLILVVCSDDLERRRLRRLLLQNGYAAIDARTPVEGLVQVTDRRPDLILLGDELPPFKSTDILPVLRRLTSSPIIVIGRGAEDEEIENLNAGADFYQGMSDSKDTLLARTRALLRRHRALNVLFGAPVASQAHLGRVA